MKTYKAHATEKASTHAETNRTDAQGRVIGYLVETYELHFVEQAEDSKVFYSIEPGHYYAARVQITKNGKAFGARQPVKYFRDETARTIWMTSKLSQRGTQA